MSKEPEPPLADSASAPVPPTRVERPSGEVERPETPARLPGAPRDGYATLPTGPVGIEPVVATGPDADAVGAPDAMGAADAEWEASGPVPVDDQTKLAPWALLAAIVALGTSFFVGWGIPVAVVAVVAALMSLRRPQESRSVARWALVLGLCATVYSVAWLVWAGIQLQQLG